MTGALIYAAVGIGNAVLLYNCFGRPRGRDWLWVTAMVALWPLIVVFSIYMAVSDSGR